MKTLFIAIFTLLTTIIFAQSTVTWVGGTPGKKTNWNEARNWSTNKVPDEYSFVIIKATNSGHFAQPEIETAVEVASIEIQAGASLIIKENAKVLIDGEYTYTKGIVNYGGSIINDGTILMFHIEEFAVEKFQNMVQGNGVVFLNGYSLDAEYIVKD